MRICECLSCTPLWCALSLILCWELRTLQRPINNTEHVGRKHRRWSVSEQTRGVENNRHMWYLRSNSLAMHSAAEDEEATVNSKRRQESNRNEEKRTINWC